MERPEGRDRQRPARHCRNPCPDPARSCPAASRCRATACSSSSSASSCAEPDALDLPRPAMAGVHDLHRDGARCHPDRPHTALGHLYAALLAHRERILGPDHQVTVTTRASLARWTEQARDGLPA
jgi:hypothetical protein